MTMLYKQDFQASTSLPSGWNFDAGFAIDATSKLSGANSLAITSTTASNAIYATQDGVSGNITNGVVFRLDSPGASSEIDLYDRMSDATLANVGTTANYYRARITLGSAPATWRLVKRSGGTSTTLLDSSTKTALNTAITAGTLLSAATAYRAYLTTNGGASPGTVVTLQIQRVSDGLWLTGSGAWVGYRASCLEVTDASSPIVGQGYAGLGTALASGATAYFDDFSIVDFADTATYAKSWADLSGFTDTAGTVSVAAGIFNGGTDAGLVLPGETGLVRAYSDVFNDRQYGNTLTGHFQFKQANYNVSQSSYFLIRGLRLLVSGNSSAIKLQGYGGTPDYVSVPFGSSTYVNGRIYELYFRVDGSTARFALKDTSTGNWLQSSGGTFSATKSWCINYTLAAPPTPGSLVGFANVSSSGSTLSVGPIKLGPCGIPQVTPSSATLATGASQAFAPLYFTGVDTVNTATSGTFAGNTYTAPGSAGTPTLTFASLIGGESVSPAVTVTATGATAYAITGPSRGFVGSASGNFTVTPNGTSSATVTITPSGGGLSTPITVTFDGTATAKTFTITPATTGTVTLTPTNSGSLANPSALTCVSMALLADAYVATSGSDSTGDGSSGSPFATPAFALSGLASTGTIHLNGGDTFAGPLTISRNNVSIRSYGTGLGIISGTVTGISTGVLSIVDCDGITLDGIKVYNAGRSASAAVSARNTDGVRRTGGMLIQNCDISGGTYPLIVQGIDANTGGWNGFQVLDNTIYDGHSVGIYFAERSVSSGFTGTNRHFSNVLIRGNDVSGITGASGTGSGIVLGNVDSVTGTGAAQCVIELNHVHDCGTLAGGAAGPAGIFPMFCDGVMVQDNLVHDIHATGGGVDGDGMDSDQHSANCTFQRNYCYNLGGPGMLLYANDNGIVVRFNIFANCGNENAIGYGGLHLSGGGSAVIHNNVFWMAPNSTLPALMGPTTSQTANKKIYNNIFVSASGRRVVDLPTLAAGFSLQGNSYQAADGLATFRFNGVDSTTLADFRAASGQESSGRGFITSDPFLGYGSTPPAPTDPTAIRSLAAFDLPAGSPLYHAGLDLQTLFSVNPGTTDYHDNAISAPYSVGASDTPPGATTFTLTGPTTGTAGVASTNFTVTPNAAYTGTITITPSGGGLSTPIVKTFSNSATPQTFTITPSSSGTVTLTPTNNGSLANPSALTYAANLATATAFTLTGPSTGAINVASSNFTVTPNAAYTGTITVTPSGGGLSTPIVLTFSASSTPQTFTIAPASVGAVTLTPSNDGSLANPAALTYTATSANATGYTLSASPSSIVAGTASTITATLTGGTSLSSTLVITLIDSLSSTISGTITIVNGSTTGTATITPSVAGNHLITATHSGGGFSGGDGSTSFAANATASSVPLATSYVLDLGSDAPTVGQRYRISARLPIGSTIASDVTVSLAGTNLQYSATQAGALANTGTITISAATGTGTAYFVPTSAGPVAPSATNGSSLTNPTITPFNASAAPTTSASSYGLYFPPVVAGTPSMGIAYLTGGTPLGSDLVIVPSGSGVTLPGTIKILAGQASVTFPFTVAQPGTATVSATHTGVSSVTDPAPTAIAASAASSPGLGGLLPSGTPFTELLRGGLATVLDAVVAANPSLSQAAVAQVHDASGSSLDRAYRGLAQLVDSYIHGDPITQSEVNSRFADYVSVFTSVAQATSEIAAMIQASPGVLKTSSSSSGNVPVMTRTFS